MSAAVALYVVRHTETGRLYVGISQNPQKRWHAHKNRAQKGNGPHFHAALRKYGADAFCFVVVGWCESKTQAQLAEIQLIRLLRPEFNTAKGGEGSWGVKHTTETRALWSRQRKGRPNPNAVAAMHANRPRNISEETRAKMSKAQTGRKHSLETRAKMSKALTGHAVSDETREKLRIASGNRTHTEEAKAKIRVAKSVVSEETRAKMRAANLNYYLSRQVKLRLNLLREAA